MIRKKAEIEASFKKIFLFQPLCFKFSSGGYYYFNTLVALENLDGLNDAILTTSPV